VLRSWMGQTVVLAADCCALWWTGLLPGRCCASVRLLVTTWEECCPPRRGTPLFTYHPRRGKSPARTKAHGLWRRTLLATRYTSVLTLLTGAQVHKHSQVRERAHIATANACLTCWPRVASIALDRPPKSKPCSGFHQSMFSP